MMYINEDRSAALAAIAGAENVAVKEEMAKHTTFRVGGEADYFVSPESVEQVKELIDYCKKEDIPYYILGNGSNLLVSDKGYEGVMIHLGSGFAGYTIMEDGIVTVKAGTSLGAVSRAVSKAGLGDMSWASGIPGSFGGACVMNAGAYGGEMKQVLKSVTYLEEDGSLVTKDVEELNLSYRNSIFKHSKRVVLEGTLALSPMPAEELLAKIEELGRQRKEKQPIEYPSAGSTFKRPTGYFAGKLIQDSGLRGFMLGGAQVSEKHCGFVINRDHATAADLYAMFGHIRKTVLEKFGVPMELEVELVGSFEEEE